MEKAMGTQQEHPLAQEIVMTEAVFLEDVAALASRAREVLASAKTQALESVGKELERVISFIRTGCPAALQFVLRRGDGPMWRPWRCSKTGP